MLIVLSQRLGNDSLCLSCMINNEMLNQCVFYVGYIMKCSVTIIFSHCVIIWDCYTIYLTDCYP